MECVAWVEWPMVLAWCRWLASAVAIWSERQFVVKHAAIGPVAIHLCRAWRPMNSSKHEFPDWDMELIREDGDSSTARGRSGRVPRTRTWASRLLGNYLRGACHRSGVD